MMPSPKVQEVLDSLQGVRSTSPGQWTALCPAHEDHHPSLSIGEGANGRVLLTCHSNGCTFEEILAALHLTPRGMSASGALPPPVSDATGNQSPGLTLIQLAAAKRIPPEKLIEFGCSNMSLKRMPVVQIEYRQVAPEVAGCIRYRLSLEGRDRFRWKTGSKAMLYGLDRLKAIRQTGWVLLVEGESDAWTGWLHDLPVLGVPGKAIWKAEWAAYLDGLAVVVWQEPEAEDFPARIARSLPQLAVIEHPPHKDLSAAHLAGESIPAYLAARRQQARPWAVIEHERQDTLRAVYRAQAQAVLEHPDPLELIAAAIKGLGYGGTVDPPVIVYLAMTSRLLAMYHGGMPVHLLAMGTSGAGKSYTISTAAALFPPDCIHEIKAGSARVLIYDDADLKHRVLIYGEADSLPSGDEDNPAASAIRALLQDHELSYDVTVRDKKGGDSSVRKIRRPGPTVLMTTSTRRLRDSQMMTRVFELEVPEDRAKNQASLKAQARNSETAPADPDPALVAFQGYLQLSAPWYVTLPYVDSLADLIGDSEAATESRVNRDFAKILSFIKTAAIVRHVSRQRDSRGWVVATLDDYRTVFELVGGMYESAVSGATEGVRRVVAAVAAVKEIGKPCNQQLVCNQLGPGTNKGSVTRWIHRALEHGWLINTEYHKRKVYALEVGEPIPDKTALPTPEALEAAWLPVASLTGESNGSHTPAIAYEL